MRNIFQPNNVILSLYSLFIVSQTKYNFQTLLEAAEIPVEQVLRCVNVRPFIAN